MSQNDLSPKEKSKKAAALEAVKAIHSDMLIGLGTGSTTTYFIDALAQRIKNEHLNISCVSSSLNSASLASRLGIRLVDIDSVTKIDLTVDGADEIDPHFNMIKGGGGALLREKILASMSQRLIIIVDEAKCVPQLGNFPLPVEIIPFAYLSTIHKIKAKGFDGKLREKDEKPYVTDNKNYIFDIHLSAPLSAPQETDLILRKIVGVVETGLFYNFATELIIGFQDGHVERRDEKHLFS